MHHRIYLCMIIPCLSFWFFIIESDVTNELDAPSRIAHAHSLLLALMQLFTAQQPMIVVIDDAVFLDQKSWALIYDIHQSVNGLLLILATRPINKSYMAAFATSVPEEYTSLHKDPNVCVITIQARPDEVIYQIACECLGIHTFYYYDCYFFFLNHIEL
jgi:hypothetical protein